MVDSTDITDEESLRAWLKDQPREVAVWIAFRGAARVLPLWWAGMLPKDPAQKLSLTVLPVLRCLLLSAVATKRPSPDIKSSAAFAVQNVTINPNRTHPAVTACVKAACAANEEQFIDAVSDCAASINRATGSTLLLDGNNPRFGEGFSSIARDAKQTSDGIVQDAKILWPLGVDHYLKEWETVKAQIAKAPDSTEWQFWIDWYEALLAGRTMLADPRRTWDMLEQIAIDSKTWDAGSEAVNPRIREIWEGYKDGAPASGRAADPEAVSEDAKSAMKQRVAVNRDALVVASAGLIDQLGTFREQVRGMNNLEPDVREDVLAFIDDFTGKLTSMLQGLPRPGETINDEQARRLVHWLREFRGFLHDEVAHYGSSQNVAKVALPTGIILAATGIGALFGQPLAGVAVGGLITSKMTPAQAAKELIKTSSKDGDAYHKDS